MASLLNSSTFYFFFLFILKIIMEKLNFIVIVSKKVKNAVNVGATVYSS